MPSPMAYNTGRSVKHLYKASPSFTIVRKDYSQERWIKNRMFFCFRINQASINSIALVVGILKTIEN